MPVRTDIRLSELIKDQWENTFLRMSEAFARVELFRGGLGAKPVSSVLREYNSVYEQLEQQSRYELPRLESFERYRDLFSVREHRYENVRLNNSAVRTKAVFAVMEETEQQKPQVRGVVISRWNMLVPMRVDDIEEPYWKEVSKRESARVRFKESSEANRYHGAER